MSNRGGWAGILKAVLSALTSRESTRRSPGTARIRRTTRASTPVGYAESPGQTGSGATRELSAGEIRGLHPSYQPQPDGDPDPGEIVWTWVPFQENDGRGKDRPVLIIARIDGGAVAGCYLSTKRHDGFISIGAGGWDSQGRESFLAPQRVLRVTESGMRREGQVLPEDRFDRAVAAIVAVHGLD